MLLILDVSLRSWTSCEKAKNIYIKSERKDWGEVKKVTGVGKVEGKG